MSEPTKKPKERSRRHQLAAISARRWLAPKQEIVRGLVSGFFAAVVSFLAHLPGGVVVTVVLAVGVGLAGAFLPALLVYVASWLAAPHEMILADIAALRNEIAAPRQLSPPVPRPEPIPMTSPTLRVDTSKDVVRIAVGNPGSDDAFFKGEIWLIDGADKSFSYSYVIKWESATGDSMLIPSHQTRYMELAKLAGGALYGWEVQFPSPYPMGALITLPKGQPEIIIKVFLKAKRVSGEQPVGGEESLTVKLQTVPTIGRDGLRVELNAEEITTKG